MAAKAHHLVWCAMILAGCGSSTVPDAAAPTTKTTGAPKFKPSSGSPRALAIDTMSYGAFSKAPQAIALGATAPMFDLPDTNNKPWSLSSHLAKNPILIMFYRGDW